MVMAARFNLKITKNMSHFKRFFSQDEDAGEPVHQDSESDLTGENKQQQEYKRRYPVREKRRSRAMCTQKCYSMHTHFLANS